MLVGDVRTEIESTKQMKLCESIRKASTRFIVSSASGASNYNNELCTSSSVKWCNLSAVLLGTFTE